MIGRFAALAAVACWIWQWDQRRREREQLARSRMPKAKPEEVTTWEGEGGALPTTGAQLGPAPMQP
jgi:hypothetical protein